MKSFIRFSYIFLIILAACFVGCGGMYGDVLFEPAYNVTYDGNGNTEGSVPLDPKNYREGDRISVLGNSGKLLRLNISGVSYKLTGWNTHADGSGSAYIEGETFAMALGPVTLYAQWTPYALRDIGPGGGYIFYIDAAVNSAAAYTAQGWKYMEAAPESTEFNAQWGSAGFSVGSTSTAIGSGKANTAVIVSWLTSNNETGRAAQLCDNLIYGGYDDWFLPSVLEISKIKGNLYDIGVGNFSSVYWSSSQQSTTDGLSVVLSKVTGSSDWCNKLYSFPVRAIRQF